MALQDLPNSTGSPRRRKPPFDIDAALYLQSQASYVQEPNRSVDGSTSCKGTPTGRLQQSRQIVSNFATKRPSLDYYATTINSGHLNNNNNISVDYIDCVSNNDLATSSEVASAAMKGIPSCRKHLRFHRNRVEPTKLNSNEPISDRQHTSSSSLLQQQKQQQLDADKTTNDDNNSNPDTNSFLNSTSIVDESSDQLNQFNIHSDPASAQHGQQNSVLYPISVSEVRKRTYFIGSVGQDALLGEDELFRYFPNGRVSIFVCTWNQNRKRAPMNLNDLLLPDQLVYMPDIYAIGIQEAFSSQTDYLRDWEIELQTTLGPNHVLLHSCSLGVLHLALFVRRDLIWFCSTPEESVYNSRSMPTNMIKTKGAVSIAFRFFGTSFMFTNCHFPAHENRLKDRIDEYQRIINSIDLPKNLKLLKPRYLSQDSTARFDCAFFMGDLNFRLEQRTFDETINILEDIFQQKELSYEALTQNDELLKVMETDQAFHGFCESQIRFPPTYKFLAQTNKYDRQTKRVPSYTDRILFRSKRQRHIQCLIYDWLPQLLSSDHKPVYCLFDVLVRPGHEQNMVGSLNAGLFQRSIYLEALKRRAEDPDGIRENGANGNLICSIS